MQISVVVANVQANEQTLATRTLKIEAEKGSSTTAVVRGLIDPKPAAQCRRGRTGWVVKGASPESSVWDVLAPAKGNVVEDSTIRQADRYAVTRSNSETIFLASGRVLSSC